MNIELFKKICAENEIALVDISDFTTQPYTIPSGRLVKPEWLAKAYINAESELPTNSSKTEFV